jgi:hypothetical protein
MSHEWAPRQTAVTSTSRWKHRRRAIAPAIPRARVLPSEQAIAHQRLDPRPLAPTRHPRSQIAPWLHTLQATPPRLREHGPPRHLRAAFRTESSLFKWRFLAFPRHRLLRRGLHRLPQPPPPIATTPQPPHRRLPPHQHRLQLAHLPQQHRPPPPWLRPRLRHRRPLPELYFEVGRTDF